MDIENSLELNVILQQVERYCSFSLGKKNIQNTKPSYEKLVIKRDHDRMQEALACCIHDGPMPFHGITDITHILDNAEKGRILQASELLDVVRFIHGINEIHAYEKSLTEVEHPSLKDLTDTLIIHNALAKEISQCINEYGEVKDSASAELKNIRASLRQAQSDMASVSARFLSNHASSVVDSIVTNRNGRTVVLIKASEKNSYGGLVYGDSASGQASYVEPASFVPYNNRIQTLQEKEKAEIEKILQYLSGKVGHYAYEEKANVETCGILDAVFAKAQWGKEREGCAASLTEEKNLVIVKGRHPLIDPKKVVANTYHLEDPKKVLLITGPNTGGKTVSLKIIGLFTLMTYCGMPVTAERAEIPFFDHVFADIGDDQSVVSSLSSFSAHMTKQAEIMQKADGNSLVLLDEIGSGTDPREGEALAISILNELRQRGTMCVVTTHYDRLKAYGKRHSDILVASVQFDMEKLMPTYKYLEGLTGQSNAFEVAERYGLPKSIIAYARHLKEQSKNEEDELIDKLEKQLNEAELKNEKLEALIADNEKEKKQLKKEKIQLDKEKENYHNKAKKEADAYVATVQNKANHILKQIRKRQENVKYHEALETVQSLNQITDEPETKKEEVPDSYEYHVGDAVELRGSSQVCEIIKIQKKDITIRMNGRDMHVKKNQIRPSVHVIPRMKKQNHVSINIDHDIFANMPQEVNLIGLHVDEAMDKMDSYMDQAKLHGLKTFRIIHGDGTGRLRKAVHESLKKNEDVKEFHLGMPQEGGTGATIVTMK